MQHKPPSPSSGSSSGVPSATTAALEMQPEIKAQANATTPSPSNLSRSNELCNCVSAFPSSSPIPPLSSPPSSSPSSPSSSSPPPPASSFSTSSPLVEGFQQLSNYQRVHMIKCHYPHKDLKFSISLLRYDGEEEFPFHLEFCNRQGDTWVFQSMVRKIIDGLSPILSSLDKKGSKLKYSNRAATPPLPSL